MGDFFFFLTQLGLFLSSIPIINKTTKKKRILHFLENGGNALLLISQTILTDYRVSHISCRNQRF